MKEIKRFHEGGYGTSEMKQSGYGDWVLYDDHDEIVDSLQEQVRALAAENEVLRNVFGPGEAVLNFLTIALRHTTYDEIDLSDVSLAFKMSLPETPATDAVIREIRAQAVSNLPKVGDGKEQEAFEIYARSRNLDLSQHPLHYLFLDGKTNQARSAWRECLVYVSSQLPAGEQP